jgi:hypothetical protein
MTPLPWSDLPVLLSAYNAWQTRGVLSVGGRTLPVSAAARPPPHATHLRFRRNGPLQRLDPSAATRLPPALAITVFGASSGNSAVAMNFGTLAFALALVAVFVRYGNPRP